MSLHRGALARIIECKRAGETNTKGQIEHLVLEYSSGELRDEEFAPWLRAVVERGLSEDETTWLTQAMAASGLTLSWSGVAGTVVDKHSTGGVGDAVSLIAVPLAAACGVRVAKLSGRALGHTGGTIDKLERIPGLRTDLSVAAFEQQVATVGCAIAQATDELAPADKKIYMLRHRTDTIESIGLITASVLSKKLAGGAPHLVIDVKCGRCAFMRTYDQAWALARSIEQVGSRCQRSVTVLVTDMEEPLAHSIGDALELDEALRVLQGGEGAKLREVVLAVAEAMLAVTDDDGPAGAAARMARLGTALNDGSAYQRFAALVRAQGGDLAALELPARPVATVTAATSGFVVGIDGRAIAEAVATREERAGDDGPILGVRLHAAIGAMIRQDQPLADVFGDPGLSRAVRDAVEVGDRPPVRRPAILARLRSRAS